MVYSVPVCSLFSSVWSTLSQIWPQSVCQVSQTYASYAIYASYAMLWDTFTPLSAVSFHPVGLLMEISLISLNLVKKNQCCARSLINKTMHKQTNKHVTNKVQHGGDCLQINRWGLEIFCCALGVSRPWRWPALFLGVTVGLIPLKHVRLWNKRSPPCAAPCCKLLNIKKKHQRHLNVIRYLRRACLSLRPSRIGNSRPVSCG